MPRGPSRITAIVLVVVAAGFAAGFGTGCGGGGLKSNGGPGVLLTFKLESGRSSAGAAATERVAKIMRARMAKLGATGTVRTDDQARTVSVRIDGLRLTERERHLVGAQANLEVFDLEPALKPPSVDARGRPVAFRSLAALAKRWPRHRQPANSVVVTCSSVTATVCPGDATGVPPVGASDYYLFKHGLDPGDRYGPFPNMTGADFKLSGTRQDFDPATEAPVVLIEFNDQGNKKFRAITHDEAARGSASGTEQHLALVLDDELRTWPAIDFKQFPNGIDPVGRGAQITGLSSLAEAKDLAIALQSGSLPARVVLVSQRRVD